MFYYQSQRDDREVREQLESLAASHPNRGSFDCYYGRIRAKGLEWNRKRFCGYIEVCDWSCAESIAGGFLNAYESFGAAKGGQLHMEHGLHA